jgi:hypothetical protein
MAHHRNDEVAVGVPASPPIGTVVVAAAGAVADAGLTD